MVLIGLERQEVYLCGAAWQKRRKYRHARRACEGHIKGRTTIVDDKGTLARYEGRPGGSPDPRDHRVGRIAGAIPFLNHGAVGDARENFLQGVAAVIEQISDGVDAGGNRDRVVGKTAGCGQEATDECGQDYFHKGGLVFHNVVEWVVYRS